MTTVAVMQPYFVPYAGYFRLFAAADKFVFLDTVQFPRRGWVHRNKLTNHDGRLSWFTLPLKKTGRDTLINELEFSSDAPDRMASLSRRFPILKDELHCHHPMVEAIYDLSESPAVYIERLVLDVCRLLEFTCETTRSSEIDGLVGKKRQDLVVAIAESQGADCYVNLSGGRELYHSERFSDKGIELRFLDEYRGPSVSILERIVCEPPRVLRDEILNGL